LAVPAARDSESMDWPRGEERGVKDGMAAFGEVSREFNLTQATQHNESSRVGGLVCRVGLVSIVTRDWD